MSSSSSARRNRGRLHGLACGFLIVSVLVPSVASAAAGTTAKAPTPKITSFAPASGKVGTRVTITGSNLRGVKSGYVAFGTTVAKKYGAASATSVWAIVPKGAKSGKISIHIPANAAPENGPIHSLQVATSHAVFVVM